MARNSRRKKQLKKDVLDHAFGCPDLQRMAKDFAEEVRDYARRTAFTDMDHGYATGEFVASIKVRQARSKRGRYIAAWQLYTDDNKAHMLEWGTDSDRPGGHSPWGPFTPTPAFLTFTKTTLRFGGIPD